MSRPKPTILIVLDGWGVAPPNDGNAIAQAKLPNINKYIASYPAMTLKASSQEVGLQFGEMGNSEVGHLSLGAGRVVYQNLPRISKTIEDKSFFKSKVFLKATAHVKQHDSKLHIIGLASTGGVHSHLNHILALLELAKKEKVSKVFVHCI